MPRTSTAAAAAAAEVGRLRRELLESQSREKRLQNQNDSLRALLARAADLAEFLCRGALLLSPAGQQEVRRCVQAMRDALR